MLHAAYKVCVEIIAGVWNQRLLMPQLGSILLYWISTPYYIYGRDSFRWLVSGPGRATPQFLRPMTKRER